MLNKLRKIAKRHERNTLIALCYEFFIRTYKYRLVRGLVSFFYSNRRPSACIFVYGCYNSGTTVLKDAISLGTNYASIPVEGDLLTDALPSFEKGEWPRALFGNAYEVELYRREGLIDKQQLFKDWAPWVCENEVFIEKSIANSLKVKQLHGLHDNYKSIVVVRRPEGVIRGIRKRSKPGLKASNFLQSSEYPIDFLLNQWLYIYKALLEDCEGNNNVIFVNYEDFIENPALVLTHIKKHLGESCDGLSFSERSIINNNQRLEILASKTTSELINPYFQGVDVALTDKVENLYRELQEKVLYER